MERRALRRSSVPMPHGPSSSSVFQSQLSDEVPKFSWLHRIAGDDRHRRRSRDASNRPILLPQGIPPTGSRHREVCRRVANEITHGLNWTMAGRLPVVFPVQACNDCSGRETGRPAIRGSVPPGFALQEVCRQTGVSPPPGGGVSITRAAAPRPPPHMATRTANPSSLAVKSPSASTWAFHGVRDEPGHVHIKRIPILDDDGDEPCGVVFFEIRDGRREGDEGWRAVAWLPGHRKRAAQSP